jgi:cytochrome c oxidase cbb3-type subunit 3
MRRPRTAVAVLAFALASCNAEKRIAEVKPAVSSAVQANRETDLVAGPFVPVGELTNPYENNQQAINDGQRLWRWMNCNGCHADGGGAIGPPLMDDQWIYGSKPGNIFETILKGRPNGMPSFAGKLPEYQMWQLVSYSAAPQLFCLGAFLLVGGDPAVRCAETFRSGTVLHLGDRHSYGDSRRAAHAFTIRLVPGV